ncbi:hypothetical protein F4824DRAFT_275426 [Ustulina deusta]|nr:hypothetical protein F4824DRAFT_275426 [Ustulina deusta]
MAPVCRRLRKLLGKKRKQAGGNSDVREEHSGCSSANPDLDSRSPSNREDSPAIQSLWDRAYGNLKNDEPKLVNDYEELLSKELQNTISDSSNDGPTQAMRPNDVSRDTDRQSQQARLNTIIEAGLQRMEEKKTKYTIAGHEFDLSDQIDQAAGLVLWAKDLIGEAVKQSPEASIVWAGVSIILPLLTNPKIADEAVRDGFKYVTTRMQYYTELEPLLLRLGKNPEVSPTVVAEANNQIIQLYERILEFQIRSVLRFYLSLLRRYLDDVIQTEDWKKMIDDIKGSERTIHSNLIEISQLVATQELESLSNKSGETLEKMGKLLSVSETQVRVATKHLGIAQKGLEMQEDEVKQKLSDKQNECIQLFRLTDTSKDATYEWYKDRVEARLDGTCEWFLDHKNFKSWLEQDSGPLLVSADPGCGKSVLAKYLIDHQLPRSSTICYFFFKDQDQNTSRQALCAVLHQLFSLKPVLIEHAVKQSKIDGPGLINSTSSLWTVLRNAVQDSRAGHIIIVLDALDECDELEFEGLIRNIENQFRGNQSSPSKLKYLLTSRPYEQIVSKFQRFLDTFPYVRIPGEEESEIISQEVNQVIKHRVEKLAKEKGLSDQVKGHLEKRLLEIQHRTYLWVYLVFDYLEKINFKKTARGVDAHFVTLPKSVYEAYERILSKSTEESRTVRKALSIILAASRPLTLSEMNVAVNVDNAAKSIHDLDLEEEEDFKKRLSSMCGLFVSIHHGKVYFLHQTAREFLLGAPTTTIPSRGPWKHSITSRNAHRVLAEICVIYIDFLNSDDILADETCFTEDESIMHSTLRICDPDLKGCSTWFNICKMTLVGQTPSPLTSILLSSYFGHEVVVKALLEKGTDLESKDENGRSPLWWAAGNGHEGVVKVLLEKGADLESKDENDGRSPLWWAAGNGHEGVVKVLLEKGADLESKDKDGLSLLLWAAAINKHKGVVKVLLKKGADLESKDKDSRSPLSWAAEEGHEAVVKLLLEKGADLESQSISGQTPISYATKKGHKAVIELLLEHGAHL